MLLLQGIFGGRFWFKVFNLVVGLGGLAMAGLGIWGAGEQIKATFAMSGSATSFGCKSPVGDSILSALRGPYSCFTIV